MISEKDCKIIDAMEKYGGSFVKQLAVLFRLADHINFEKLKNTFSEYWDQYEKMA